MSLDPQEAVQPSRADGVAGERARTTVNRIRSVQSRASQALALTLFGALVIGGLIWYYARLLSDASDVNSSLPRTSAPTGEMRLPPLGTLSRPPQKSDAVEKLMGPPPPLPAARAPSRKSGHAQRQAQLPSALERQLAGPVIVRANDSIASRRGGTAPPPRAATSGRSASGSSMALNGAGSGRFSTTGRAGDSDMDALLRPTAIHATQAQTLPTQRMLLAKGTTIDCTLETAIDSTLPGFTRCITATDTWSADGTVVLIERGSTLFGETRGNVQQGQRRLFVLWTEVRTPEGVVIPLASPGTDELGRAGVTGQVNRHFWQRFGAAILISVIDGAIRELTRPDGGNTVVINPSTTRDVISEVLRGTVNIRPTLRVHQGTRITVLVARDVDFGSVYELGSR